MQIIVINKGETPKRPPVISVLFILRQLGYNVKLVTCAASDAFIKMMNDIDIEVTILPYNQRTSKIGKTIDYLLFRRHTLNFLNKNSNANALIWLADAPSIIAMGKKIKKFNYILQIQELHENSKFQLKAISRVIHQAKAVFMPEYNRTVLYQIWFGLKQRPIVLPNKPYFIPDKIELQKLKEKYKNEISACEGKKIILYQGGISKVRLLDKIAHAITELNENYLLLLVGKEQEPGYISKLKSISNSIIHIPYLPAPDYLVFSTIAYFGYVCYAPTSLNNAYCAPNKINEYSAFNLPMIGNDIPGLRMIFEQTGAGVIVDEHSIESIKDGINKIDSNYELFKQNASKIFNMYDNVKTIKNTLEFCK